MKKGRRSILGEKKKVDLVPKDRDDVFEARKSTVGMPTGTGDKSRAGWHATPQIPALPVEHKQPPGTTGGNVAGLNILKHDQKMPALTEDGTLEDIRNQPAEFIERKVGSEGEVPKARKLTIMEKLFGVKKEIGEITPQYQPTTKVYRGRSSRRRISQE